MPSERAAGFADDLARANDEAIGFAESCSDADWHTVVPGENWTVGVVLHHIAEGHASVVGWLTAMASGDGVVDTVDDIDQRNVTHQEQWADVSVADAVALLRDNGARAEQFLRQLSDDDLDRVAPFGPAGGRELPLSQLAVVSCGHARDHLAHAKEAVNRSA